VQGQDVKISVLMTVTISWEKNQPKTISKNRDGEE